MNNLSIEQFIGASWVSHENIRKPINRIVLGILWGQGQIGKAIFVSFWHLKLGVKSERVLVNSR